MDIRDMTWYRKHKIAIRLLFVMILQLCSPLSNIFVYAASPISKPNLDGPSPTQIATGSDGRNSTWRYQTEGYNIEVVDGNGNIVIIHVPAQASTEYKNGKAVTTHTFDLDYFDSQLRTIPGASWDQFLGDDGQYHLFSNNSMAILKNGIQDGDPVVGPEGMKNCGVDWSNTTDAGLNSDDPEENPATSGFVIPPDAIPTESPIPTNTPMPTATETPKPTKAPITNTPIPTNHPTDIPVTETPTPTPKPTATPTPEPTLSPTPFPTPEPVTYTYYNNYEYHKYYSSTNGHSVSDISLNRKIADDTSANTASLSEALSAVGTKTSYAIGTDASGNEWYLLTNRVEVANNYGGSSYEYYATSVHPKKYGGHAVDSAAIRYINSLVIPERITCGGINYTVKSVGGSGPYYYGEPTSAIDGTVSSNLNTYYGDYSWKDGASTWEFSYLLGSMGSGTITSKGFGINIEYDYNTYIYNNTYSTNYYVYNTTLSSITIPSTCETIEDYAFHNCQALVHINGAENLKTIGTHAFSVAEVPELKRSHQYRPSYWAYEYSITDLIYSYDDSFTLQYAGAYPATMTKFQEYTTICQTMFFPSFPSLVTIGESAFEGRYHLDTVVLENTVETVHKNAFKGCLLDRITVPNEKTAIKGGYDTLGTKGPEVIFLTEIVTPSTAPAYPRMYGEMYDAYYRVFQDAYIYYHPNGGTPDTVYSELAEIEYKDASFGDTYFDLGNACILWLGDDGYVYYACVDDTNVLRGNIVSALRSLRFVSMEKKAELGGYYEAVTADGRYCYISATTVSVKGKRYESVYQGPDLGWNDVLVEYHRYYEPSVSYFYVPGYLKCVELTNITFPAGNGWAMSSSPGFGTAYGIKAVSADGRFHYQYNGRWISEPAWPSGVTVVQAIENTATAIQFGWLYDQRSSNQAYEAGYPCSYYEYASLKHHGTILCSDGSVYVKIGISDAWTKLEGTYIGISAGETVSANYGQGNSSSYAYYRDYITLNKDYLYERVNTTTYRRYQIDFNSEWNSTTMKYSHSLYAKRSTYTDVDSSSVEFANPLPSAIAIATVSEGQDMVATMSTRTTDTVVGTETYLYTYPNGSDSDMYYSVERHYVFIFQDSSTKAMTMRAHYTSDNNASDAYPGTENYSDYAAGTGTFLAARFKTTGTSGMGCNITKRFIYYFGADGGLYCTYGENYATSTTKVSDFNFVKYYLLSPNFAPMGGDNWSVHQTQKHGSHTGSSGNSTYSEGDYINLICLDANGHLWSGVLGYGSATFTQMSDKVFVDFLYKEITERTGYQSGNTVSGDYTDTVYARLYALDTNKDLYKYDQVIKKITSDYESGENTTQINGNWVVTSTWNSNHISTTHYGYNSLSLEYMDYDLDVLKFLSYPIILMEGNKPGLLTTTDAVTDIYCGVDLVYRIAGNKWFWAPSGKEFAGYWNTAADGTGTKRMVGDKVLSTSYATNWQDSAEDMHLYAQWTNATSLPDRIKTVVYDANGGIGDIIPNSQTIPIGKLTFPVAKNENPGFSKDGYLFTTWNTKPDGTGITYTPGSEGTVTGVYTVLYAQWRPIKYTVTFAFDEIRAAENSFFYTEDVFFRDAVSMPKEPQRKEVFVDYDINTTDMSTASLAKWITALPLAEKYRRSIQQFQGWDLYHYNTVVADYVGGYYRFPEFEEVRQLCDTEGDTAYMFPVWGGIDAYVLLPEVSCPGYNFFGWLNNKTLETSTQKAWYIPEEGGGCYLPTGNDTLYAWWDPCKYEITLIQTRDGVAPDVAGDDSVVMTFDKICPDVTTPQMDHYVFIGYNTKPDGTGDWYYGEADRTTNISTAYEGKLWQIYDGSVTTLYAQWRPDKAIQYEANYTPTSPENDNDYNTTWIDYIITTGSTWKLIPNKFTQIGYTFLGWNLKQNGSGTSYSDGETIDIAWITGPVPFYAQWNANTYSLQYDLKGNKPTASTDTKITTAPIHATYDTSFTISNPTKVGYTFLGWNVTGMDNCIHSNGLLTSTTTSFVKTKETLFKNLRSTDGTVVFTAQWEPKTYIVALDDRGATSINHTTSVTMTFDAAFPAITPPIKHGYNFEGYYSGIKGSGEKYYNADGTGAQSTWTAEDEGVTILYAYWTPWTDTQMGYPVMPSTTPTPLPEPNDLGSNKTIEIEAYYEQPSVMLSDENYSVSGAIPSTEEIKADIKISEYLFKGQLERVYGVDNIWVQVQIPYRVQTVDANEKLSWTTTGIYTSDPIPVPRSFCYWKVTQDELYTPYLVTIENDAFTEKKNISEFVPNTTNSGFTYQITHHTYEEAITDPDNTDTYGNYPYDYHVDYLPVSTQIQGTTTTYTDEILIILHEGDTLATELEKTAKIYAYQTAYGLDSRQEIIPQLNVRSDLLLIDGNTIVSDTMTTGVNVVPIGTNALTNVRNKMDTVINKNVESISLNSRSKNGLHDSSVTVDYALTTYENGILVQDVNVLKIKDVSAVTDVSIHTPVLINKNILPFTHTNLDQSPHQNNDGTWDKEEEDPTVTVDEYAEFLTMNLDDFMKGTHISQLGYQNQDYETTASGQYTFDRILLRADVALYFDKNQDTEVQIASVTNNADDVYFEANELIQILLRNGNYYLVTPTGNVLVNKSDIVFYTLATQCTGDFTVKYGVLAVNGDFTTNYYSNNFNALFDELSESEYVQELANLNTNAYFAHYEQEYKVHYKYITFHWYATEEPCTKVSDDERTIVMKQGYEGYFYATQIENFKGSIEVIPTFSLVDYQGNVISDDILVFYNDQKEINGVSRKVYGCIPEEDSIEKEFYTPWLKLDFVDHELSQTWTYRQVLVNQHSKAIRNVYGADMEALHGMYRLPNGIQVVRKENIPNTTFGTAQEFITSATIRDKVFQSTIELPFSTEGYLLVSLDLAVLNEDGSVLIEHNSLEPIFLYYILGDTSVDGLYATQNGHTAIGTGKDSDYNNQHHIPN